MILFLACGWATPKKPKQKNTCKHPIKEDRLYTNIKSLKEDDRKFVEKIIENLIEKDVLLEEVEDILYGPQRKIQGHDVNNQ